MPRQAGAAGRALSVSDRMPWLLPSTDQVVGNLRSVPLDLRLVQLAAVGHKFLIDDVGAGCEVKQGQGSRRVMLRMHTRLRSSP